MKPTVNKCGVVGGWTSSNGGRGKLVEQAQTWCCPRLQIFFLENPRRISDDVTQSSEWCAFRSEYWIWNDGLEQVRTEVSTYFTQWALLLAPGGKTCETVKWPKYQVNLGSLQALRVFEFDCSIHSVAWQLNIKFPPRTLNFRTSLVVWLSCPKSRTAYHTMIRENIRMAMIRQLLPLGETALHLG